jgi:N-acetylglutamate synthase/N-acetylornithine aminotransferase
MLRGAELMRAETASWGRALASIGLGGKQIATSDEVSQVQEKPVVVNVSVAAAEFMAWANKEKIHKDKIKLCLGAMGIAMGNKHLKTLVTSLTDEQIQTLREKLA